MYNIKYKGIRLYMYNIITTSIYKLIEIENLPDRVKTSL